jgi:hypothetical protein
VSWLLRAPVLSGCLALAAQAQVVDPSAFPAQAPRARQLLGYASPWTLFILAAAIVLLAALIKRFDPKRRKRIRRVTILYML